MLSLLGNLFANGQTSVRYEQLPELPPKNGKPNPGVAGAFAGVSHGVLLLAGGANFPDGYPWQNGSKVWQSTICILAQAGKSTQWQTVGSLEKPLAYGASVGWNERIICLGGNDATQCYADVFTLTWDAKTQQIRIETLPKLPQAVANLSASVLGDELYAFGGESDRGPGRSLFVLNLLQPEKGWQLRADLPGPARAFTALVSLPQAANPSLFVLGGRQTIANQTTVFGDAYQYHANRNEWTKLPDLPVAVAAHEAASFDMNQLVVFGGDDGIRLRQIEELNNRIRQQPDDPEKGDWINQRNTLQAKHPGFRREIWQYQTDTGRWSVIGQMPFPAPVTTTAVRWGKGFVLPSGEVSPGVRTPAVRLLTPFNL